MEKQAQNAFSKKIQQNKKVDKLHTKAGRQSQKLVLLIKFDWILGRAPIDKAFLGRCRCFHCR